MTVSSLGFGPQQSTREHLLQFQLHLLFRQALAHLEAADELIPLTFNDLRFIIGELTPTFFDPAFVKRPSLDDVFPNHDLSLRHRGLINPPCSHIERNSANTGEAGA